MSARISGFGTAFPRRIDQDEVWAGYFAPRLGHSRVAERLFRAAGVEHRHAVADPLVDDVSDWSTERRMLRYAAEAPALGKEAVSAALADAGLAAEEVGLLAVVSCTGYATPGLDIHLAADLGMPADVQRLVIGHMGCYAALPGLGAVADHVVARGRPAVLLCLELTSLHAQPTTDDLAQVITHALFADAAAAVVLRPGPDGAGPDDPGGAAGPGIGVRDLVARTAPATADHMRWDITDRGFRMELSPRVPDVLGRHVGPAVDDLLARNGLTRADVGAWAVHPGGPRILDTVADVLGLPRDALAASRAVLRERGNCSSATVLLILDELRRRGLPAGAPVVAMAFGPGLTLYAGLLDA
ncbi:type III polyketide synthase [Actinokineospora bangkokensis]|uniref:type III polyketide synthase n=1 Tax=Actinokineospora bangkokensis TaxID=1193682 RepID=UPI002FCE046C